MAANRVIEQKRKNHRMRTREPQLNGDRTILRSGPRKVPLRFDDIIFSNSPKSEGRPKTIKTFCYQTPLSKPVIDQTILHPTNRISEEQVEF